MKKSSYKKFKNVYINGYKVYNNGHKVYNNEYKVYNNGYKHFLKPNKKSIFDELFSFLKNLFKKG